MTKLDELRVLLATQPEYVKEWITVDDLRALIAAVEALEELIAVENIDYNDLPEPEFQTFEKRYDAAREAARAALAPFGERLWLKNRMLAGHLCM